MKKEPFMIQDYTWLILESKLNQTWFLIQVYYSPIISDRLKGTL